ncbi:MAG: T9SS type A sorting domain-containing protein [Ignavibacteriales bacterium]|nr:Ycf48-like protein [Ignavibacteriaceae bacterium]MBW7873000.1 T9SS type A sorting domain-containing protein [Ignavibacteria bacterium]MBZ0196047.1 T9SS type A sorting domain-containing protein [Ignavibacteriaceae bacterium]MCZ2142371.1 T9SS type A sorting domain-containing protein [Ignavibacteriales bacterium]WKZ73534.1 MAG: YCF48-related protein [Ignavibacteriaceae bacterium]
MRNFIIFVVFFFCSTGVFAQQHWITQNPYPTSNDMHAGAAIGENKFIALSNYDQCLLSTDGGVNWSITSYDTTESIIRNLYFYDDNLGWAAGALGGGFYRTTNGGTSWIQITNAPDTTKYGIYFVTPMIGWSVGFFGFIIKTTDGGQTWFSQSNTAISNKTLYGVYATDPQTVFVVGNTGTVLKSTNGGDSFAQLNLGAITSADYRAVRFINADTGFVVGARHRIIKTTDGGASWVQQNDVSSTSRVLWDIDFNSQGVGIAVGTDTIGFRTTDFGTSWAQIIMPGGSGPGVKYAVDFYGDNTLFVNGGRGYLAKSTDAGANFTELGYRFTNATLNDVAFADANIGYICATGGYIGKTTNGGTTWSDIRVPNGRKINEITVPDANTIYGACDSSRIVFSKDGGATWSEYSAGLGNTHQFIAIDHFSQNVVMVTGTNGIVLKTTDGGVSWLQYNLPNNVLAWDICVVDEEFAWICGTGETVFRTTDGGVSWVQQLAMGGLGSYGISFADRDRGFVAGSSGNTYWTTNGGTAWSPATLKPNFTVWSTAIVKFGSETRAFAACASGYAFTSNDGGNTWKQEPRQTINTFNDMFALDAGTAWCMGNSGSVVKYYNPDAVPVEMLSFNGSVQGRDVAIAWSVGNTVNNRGYSLQRATTGAGFGAGADFSGGAGFGNITTTGAGSGAGTGMGSGIGAGNNSENWTEIHFVSTNGECGYCSYEFTDKNLEPGAYKYRLAQFDYDGSVRYYYLSEIMEVGIVRDFALEQNYPNPFNPSTSIKFSLPVGANVSLVVYNSLGEKVAVLADGVKEAGVHSVAFDAVALPSGIYFYELKAGGFSAVKKMMLLK